MPVKDSLSAMAVSSSEETEAFVCQGRGGESSRRRIRAPAGLRASVRRFVNAPETLSASNDRYIAVCKCKVLKSIHCFITVGTATQRGTLYLTNSLANMGINGIGQPNLNLGKWFQKWKQGTAMLGHSDRKPGLPTTRGAGRPRLARTKPEA
jgi:hypothetical protein